MSDFLFSTARRPPGTLRAALDLYLAPVTEACLEYHGDWGSLAVARASHDRDVVREGTRRMVQVGLDAIWRLAAKDRERDGTGGRSSA